VYGSGSGNSYGNAWSGVAKIRTSVNDGDTIIVCGTHRETLIVRNSNLTINLDCPNDPAVILGSEATRIGSWKGPDANGEYFQQFPVTPNVIAKDGDVMLKGTVGSLIPGQWGKRGATVYIKNNPVGHTFEVGQRGRGIQIGESNDINGGVVHGITVLGGGKAWIKYVGAHNQYSIYGNGISAFHDGWPHANFGGTWTIDGVNFYGIAVQAIHTNGTSTPDNIYIRNCKILETGGEAIYLKGVFGGGVIENNVIGDQNHVKLGWDGLGYGNSYDGDGIDIGGGPATASKNLTIRNNTITNIRGNGIVAVGGNLLIEDNIIENTNAWNEPGNKACIYVDPVYALPTVIRRNKCVTAHSDGVQIRGSATVNARMSLFANLIVLRDRPRTYAAIRYNSYNARNTEYFNNTLAGGRYGMYWSSSTENPVNIRIGNNIFYDQDYPLYMLPAIASGLTAKRNIFWPTGAQAKPFKIGRIDHGNIKSVQTRLASFTDNLLSDPRFIDPAQGDYRLSPQSPGLGKGIKWWPAGQDNDYRGNAFMETGSDIGAIQSRLGHKP
jgi:hypothetical protein